MGQFLNSIKDVSKNYKLYDDWEQEQDNVLERKQHLIKVKPLDKTEKDTLEKKAANIVRVSELMDTRSEDNAQDVEFLTGAAAGIGSLGILSLAQIGIHKYFNKKMMNAGSKEAEKLFLKKYFGSQIGMVFAALAVAAGFILWGNSKTKEASRLGRFQAKKNDLKDEKSFVLFTPEQIAQAEKIAATMPDEKQRKGILRAIKNVKGMYRDLPAYKEHKKSLKRNNPTQTPVQNLTKEQLIQAEKDKELLLNVIKKINNTAEDYSENVENAFDTLEATSFLATIPIGMGLNKLFKSLKLKIPRTKVAGGIALLFPLMTGLWSLSAEKKAARVGRYVAKKDILKNPELLRKFSDEDMKSVENIKAPKRAKGFFKKIAENLRFIPQYLKDQKAYNQYVKTERPKNEKLNKALLQVEVTDEQRKEAKHLQDKTFMSFDKIDEMSQRYSEDMEAAGEIGKKLVTTTFSLVGIGAMIGASALFFTGKIPMHKIIKFLSKLTFKKSSSIRQTVDESYKIINGDKTLKKAFNKLLSPAPGKREAAGTLLNSNLLETVAKKNPSIIEYILNPTLIIEKAKTIKLSDIMPHLNDNPIAKWARNLIIEISALTAKSKAPYNYTKEVSQAADSAIASLTGRKITNNYSRYKTLINTSIVGGIPVLGVIVGIPYAICSWLTNIQKKAGKIGVMKAIKELDNTNLYVNTHNASISTENKPKSDTPTSDKNATKQNEIIKEFLKK